MEDPSNIAPEFERARLRAARGQLDALGLTPATLALSAARLARARRAVERMVDELCDPRQGAVRTEPWGVIGIDRTRLRQAAEEVALRVLNRAVAAAGGSAEPVPLGRLEAIAAAVCGGRHVGRLAAHGRWTLARALITAEASVVTLEREPGREPLPELSVAPGASAVWDGRFRVTVAGSFTGGPVLVRALGEADLRDLRRRGHGQDGAPARAVAAVPSFRHQGRLVAVPSLRYWEPPGAAANLEAVFLGLQEAGAARDWP